MTNGTTPPTQTTPSMVFPIPGYSGTISPHGTDAAGNPQYGGSDIMAPSGSTVVSMVSGKVSFLSTQQTAPGSGGNAVEITGVNGLEYYYAHLLNPVGLKMGEQVTAGQVLGQVDNTGNAATTASHLHIGIGPSISSGTGPTAGIGDGSYNAVAALTALEKDPNANNPDIGTGNFTSNPPSINFVPSVPGFTSANLANIQMVINESLKFGIDPFLYLAVVSHESGWQDGVMNQQGSGACGFAQLLPCTDQYGQANIDAGLTKLKSYLQQCNGDYTCALDQHYAGTDPGYTATYITPLINAIKGANPDLVSYVNNLVQSGAANPSISWSGGGSGGGGGGGGVGGGGSGGFSSSPGGLQTVQDICPPTMLGPFVANVSIPFPDIACIINYTITQWKNGLATWWSTWQTEHVPAWTFVIIGIIFVLIGANVIGNSSAMSGPAQTAIKMVGPELMGA